MDLDLFTRDPGAFERGVATLGAAAEQVGATLSVKQDAPGFKRYLASRANDGVLIDLVLERVPAAYDRVNRRGSIILDIPEEIAVNKLTTLVSRSELRDLVDLMLLERSGCSIDEALPKALQKDGGCTPATLAWVLSEIHIGDDGALPAEVPPETLRQFLRELIERLLRLAAADAAGVAKAAASGEP